MPASTGARVPFLAAFESTYQPDHDIAVAETTAGLPAVTAGFDVALLRTGHDPAARVGRDRGSHDRPDGLPATAAESDERPGA